MPAHDAAPVGIFDLQACPQHLHAVGRWIHEEWGHLSAEDVSLALEPDPACPPNLIALAGDEPVGFLTFKRHSLDELEEMPVWINSLYVDSAWRRRGIGSRLLDEGQRRARRHGHNELYVYTEIPAFYELHEWTVFKDARDPRFRILKLPLHPLPGESHS